jgi:hypothetical protein
MHNAANLLFYLDDNDLVYLYKVRHSQQPWIAHIFVPSLIRFSVAGKSKDLGLCIRALTHTIREGDFEPCKLWKHECGLYTTSTR